MPSRRSLWSRSFRHACMRQNVGRASVDRHEDALTGHAHCKPVKTCDFRGKSRAHLQQVRFLRLGQADRTKLVLQIVRTFAERIVRTVLEVSAHDVFQVVHEKLAIGFANERQFFAHRILFLARRKNSLAVPNARRAVNFVRKRVRSEDVAEVEARFIRIEMIFETNS